ncbi:MAG: M17 family peptidase N-terminal domain-containing protein, partial [Planctomycetota bacterium]
MNINVKTGTAEKEPAEMLAFYVYEDAVIIGGALASCNSELNNVIAEIIKKKEFVGKLNKSVALFTYGKIPANRILLVGLGKKKDVTPDKVRQAAGTTASVARDMGVSEVVAVLDSIEMPSFSFGEWTQAYGEGCLLAGYNFVRYKKVPQEEQKELKSVTLLFAGKEAIVPARNAVKHAQIIAESVCFARDLINTPAQDKTPTALADIAKKIAKSQGFQCKALSTLELKKLGMGGLLGVSQGS